MSSRAFLAGGTIRVCRFVKLDTTANHTLLEADANERVHGISQDGSRVAPTPSVTADPPEAAQDGEQLQIHEEGEQCLLLIGTGGCTANDRLKSDADGKGVAIATTGTTIQHYGAVALETASAGEYAKVRVQIGSERPALS